MKKACGVAELAQRATVNREIAGSSPAAAEPSDERLHELLDDVQVELQVAMLLVERRRWDRVVRSLQRIGSWSGDAIAEVTKQRSIAIAAEAGCDEVMGRRGTRTR